MAYGGAAVGRLSDGAAVFVSGGLPGETVEVDLTDRKKSFARGRLLSVLEASPERVEPPCRHFLYGCGGCQWQYASYASQLSFKQNILADQLRRGGGIAEAVMLESITAPQPFNYRNVAEFHVRDGRIGFNREGSHDLVDITECPLVEAPINHALTIIRSAQKRLGEAATIQVRSGVEAIHITLFTDDEPRGYKMLAAELADRIGGEVHVTAVGNGTNRMRGAFGDPWIWMSLPLDPGTVRPVIPESGEGPSENPRFRTSALSFFQVNTAMAGKLASEVVSHVQANDRVLDLYCGVGTFALLAAEKAREVVGVEESASAMADAATNAAENATDNVKFERLDVGAAHAIAEEGWDLTILDPPRSGCPRSVLEVLKSERLVYVSCDPSTLARDLRILTGRGYKLENTRLFDMFPQTYHLETLSILSRSGSGQ